MLQGSGSGTKALRGMQGAQFPQENTHGRYSHSVSGRPTSRKVLEQSSLLERGREGRGRKIGEERETSQGRESRGEGRGEKGRRGRDRKGGKGEVMRGKERGMEGKENKSRKAERVTVRLHRGRL